MLSLEIPVTKIIENLEKILFLLKITFSKSLIQGDLVIRHYKHDLISPNQRVVDSDFSTVAIRAQVMKSLCI